MNSLTAYQRNKTTVYAIEAPSNAALRTINFYLVDHDGALCLVDAGMDNDACWDTFTMVMQELDYAIADLASVILTHHHPDHVGLVHRIRERNPKLKVYAHPLAIPYLTQDRSFLTNRLSFFEKLYRSMDGMPEAERQMERWRASIDEQEPFRLSGDIDCVRDGDSILDCAVLDVPGHAPDHVLLHDPLRKWAFAGDLVIEHMSTNAVIEPDANGRLLPTVTQQIASLKRCLSLDVNLLFTGHGTVIREPQAAIESKLTRIEQKMERMMSFIRDGYATAGSIVRTYARDTLDKQYFLVISEVVGMLDHLERTGHVVSRLKNGVYHYALTRRDYDVSI